MKQRGLKERPGRLDGGVIGQHPHSQFWTNLGSGSARGRGEAVGDPGPSSLLTPKLKLGSQPGHSQPPGALVL